MNNLEDMGSSMKVSDSAYASSCSNSQSRRRMDNLEDMAYSIKISDSAYANSCSNSQSRRSRSSKSTRSGSNSSGSSGYGGKPSTSGSSSDNLGQTSKKDKDSKKKKQTQSQTETMAVEEEECLLECRPPEEISFSDTNKEEICNVGETMTAPLALPVNAVETMNVSASELSTNKDEIKTATISENVSIQTSCQIANNDSNGFSCAISMHDGVVMYTSNSLTTYLGFPKDMWIGRSFIDFVHPKDRSTFASQITNVLAIPEAEKVKSSVISSCTMGCRIRRYRSLNISFGITDQSVAYVPFLLKFSSKDVNDDGGKVVYLIIHATRIYSAFKTRNECLANATPFTMRHSASGVLDHIDLESIPYLGYLPQDILNESALLLYHPEDLPYLKMVYESIVKECSVVKSMPYRMLAQNGNYVKLETEWSSFINPWSMKLEFVIGKHRVVEGPAVPDVFLPQIITPVNTSEKAKKNARTAEMYMESILMILKNVLSKPAEEAKVQIRKRCQNLAMIMEKLLVEPDEELKVEAQEPDPNPFDKDLALLGGISPISYNQLNYNENLQRYFDSQPYCEEEAALLPKSPNQLAEFTSVCRKSPLALHSYNKSIEFSNSSSFAALKLASESSSAESFHSSRLTETLLTKHNNEMQKKLAKNHRDCRYKAANKAECASDSRQKKKEHLVRCNAAFQPTTAGIADEVAQPQGLKRASMLTEEGVALKRPCSDPHPSLHQTASNTAAHVPPTTTLTTSTGAFPMYYAPADVSTTVHMNSSIGRPGGQPWTNSQTDQMLPPLSHEMRTPAPWTSLPPVHGTPLMNPQMAYNFQQQQATILYNNSLEQSMNQSLNSLTLASSNYLQITEPKLQPIPGESPSKTISCQSVYNSDLTTEKTEGGSTYSSFYSSFLSHTESGSAEESSDPNKSCHENVKKNPVAVPVPGSKYKPEKFMTAQRRSTIPPWLEEVSLTPDLIYKYQIQSKSKKEVLQADLERMKALRQPPLVNEQLRQLYMDLQLEGVASRLTLEEGITSSSSSDEEMNLLKRKSQRVLRKRNYSKLHMIYEEDAPMPPPATDLEASSGEPPKQVHS